MKKIKKLSLHRETVRNLNAALVGIRSGVDTAPTLVDEMCTTTGTGGPGGGTFTCATCYGPRCATMP